LLKCKNDRQALPRIIQWLSEVRKRFPTTLTAVITANRAQSKEAFDLLKPTFGNELRLGDNESLTFESGIAVIDTKSAKGLEFFAVLIWDPSMEAYPNTDLGRRTLYTGMTRAEEHLLVVHWNRPSSLLPSPNSPLVRGEDMTFSEDNR